MEIKFLYKHHTQGITLAKNLSLGKSHINNDVCQHKLAAAVVLNPRNTELQLTQDGAYQVAFEVEFDKPIGQTQFSHKPA